LEQAYGAARCDTCRDRDENAVIYHEDSEDGADALPESCLPCSACGWEPNIIHVVFAEEAAKL
jgi:hypothetical protein